MIRRVFGTFRASQWRTVASLLLLSMLCISTLAGASLSAQASNRDGSGLQPLTVLLMGVDARPGEQIDLGVRPDALRVLRFDPVSRSCKMLIISRDTRFDLPDYGPTRISNALMVGGIPLQTTVVEQLLDIPIDHFALLDFGGFEHIIDKMGGITLTVTESFSNEGFQFEPGTRLMTGAEALAYIRYIDTVDPDGDFRRIDRQQEFVSVFMKEILTIDPATMLGDLLPELTDHFRTDLEPAQLLALGAALATDCSTETVDMLRLEGSVVTADDPITGQSTDYLVPDADEIRTTVEEFLATS